MPKECLETNLSPIQEVKCQPLVLFASIINDNSGTLYGINVIRQNPKSDMTSFQLRRMKKRTRLLTTSFPRRCQEILTLRQKNKREKKLARMLMLRMHQKCLPHRKNTCQLQEPSGDKTTKTLYINLRNCMSGLSNQCLSQGEFVWMARESKSFSLDNLALTCINLIGLFV